MIDAIIPIDLARRPWNLLRRLRLQQARAAQTGISLVVGHNDRGTWADALLHRFCRRHGVRLVSGAFYGGQVNNARLRNEAMRAVTAAQTLLLDVDVLLDAEAVTRMVAGLDGFEGRRRAQDSGDRNNSGNHSRTHCRAHSKARSSDACAMDIAPFCVLPCLYLSARGSHMLIRGNTTIDRLLERYWAFERAPFLHLAVPSSVVLFASEDFRAVGGFDERFDGHGYEDLDFLLRLALLHKLVPATSVLSCDRPCRAPLLSRGFRACLVRLALPPLLDGTVAVHLWHATKKDGYYKTRDANAALFAEKLAAMVPSDPTPSKQRERSVSRTPAATEASYPDTSLIDFWSALCRTRCVAAERYSILFDDRPGHIDRARDLRARLATRLARLAI